jgi:hypothetical protein
MANKNDVVINADVAELIGGSNIIFRIIDARVGQIRIAPVAPALPMGVDFESAFWVFPDDVREVA